MDFINLLSFVSLNLMLLLSARLILNFLPGTSGSRGKIFLGTATIFFTLIILIEICLGVVGILSYPAIALFTIMLSAALIFHQRKNLARIFTSEKKDRSPETDKDYYFLIAFFAPAVILLAFRFFDALFQIPFDFDATIYHLPLVVDWLQNSSIWDPYYGAMKSPLGHYPSNVELLYLWTILPFWNDFFVDLINFLFYGLFCLGVYEVCRNFSFEKRISLITAGIALYIPLFMHQAGLVFVDMFFIMTLVFGVFFLQEVAAQKDKAGAKILAGLALGLFVGTKYLGIVYVALPILIFLFLIKGSKRYWIGVLQFFAALFLSGGFFYLRNWVESGNPLYPASVSIGGLSIFSGYEGVEKFISGSSIWAHLGELETYKSFFKNFLLICDAPGVLMMLGLFFTFLYVVYRILRGDKIKQLKMPVLLLVAALFYLFTYINAPYTNAQMIYNIRYMMPLILVGMFNWAYLMKISGKYSHILFLILMFAVARSFIYSIAFPGYKLLLNFEILSLYQSHLIIFLTALFILFFVYPLLKKIFTRIAILLISIAMLGTVLNFAYEEQEALVPYYVNRWYPRDNMFRGDFQAALWFNENDNDARIAYAGFDFHYHLFGRDLKREVDYVNVNNCLQCSFSDYDHFEDLNLHNANFEDWIKNLDLLKKEYVVLHDNTLEYAWIENAPEIFQLVEKFGDTYIFRILTF